MIATTGSGELVVFDKKKKESPSLAEMVRGSGPLTLRLLDQASGDTSWTQQELLLIRMVTFM